MDNMQETIDAHLAADNSAYFMRLPESRKTEPVCRSAVNADTSNIRYVPLQSYSLEIMRSALSDDPSRICDMPQEALKRLLPNVLENDEELMRKISQKELPEEILADIAAHIPHCLQYIPELKRTPGICLAAVGHGGESLEYVPEKLKTPELCMAAVRNNGFALDYVPENLRSPQLCMEAVRRTCWALEFVPEQVKTPELCQEALRRMQCMDYELLSFIPFPDMCMDGICRLRGKLATDSRIFGAVRPEIMTEDFVCKAAKTFGNGILVSGNVPERLRTEKAYLSGMWKEDERTFLAIPTGSRSAEICLKADEWYRELVRLHPDLIPDSVRNGCNVYSLGRKMEECTGEHFTAGQIRKLYEGKPLFVKEIDTPNGKKRNVSVTFDRKQEVFHFSPFRQSKRKGRKIG